MQMKPEYNHGTYKETAIRLLKESIGDKPLRVQYILKQIETGKIEFKSQKRGSSFFSPLSAVRTLLFLEVLTDENEVQILLDKFNWAGAKPEVCYQTFYFAFPPDAFVEIIDWRKKYDEIWGFNFDSSAFCGELTFMNEYSLSKWAEANGVQEAYRLCIFPSFEPAQVIRVWFHEGMGYVIHKKQIESFCPDKAKILNASNIDIETWHVLQSYMVKKFWSAKSWYSVPEGGGMLDGTIYYFEGWGDGKYKVLDDHSPDDGVSYYAIEHFETVAK